MFKQIHEANNQQEASCKNSSAGYLLVLLFDPADESSMSLLDVGELLSEFTVSQPKI
jgi:hypothetical protein